MYIEHMKRLLVLLMLLIPVTAFCRRKYRPRPMPVSRWREIKRMKPDSTVVAFADTMFISFQRKDSFSYHHKNGFIYRGTYTINKDSLLDFGTARYKIKIRKPNNLVLLDDKGIYQFIIDTSDTVKVIVLHKKEKILPVTSIDQMIGHWTVYKRTSAKKASGALRNSVAIRSIYITGESTDGKLGYIFSGSDPGDRPSWYIKSYGIDQTLDCAGKTPRALKVVKCQDNDMILQEESMKYYLKQFK